MFGCFTWYLLLVCRLSIEHIGAELVHWRCSGVVLVRFSTFSSYSRYFCAVASVHQGFDGLQSWADNCVSHCQTNGHMERDSSCRLSLGMEMLDNIDNVLPPGRLELREAAVGEMAVPVVESCPEVSVEEAVELDKAGGSIWDDFSRKTREINSSVRMWVSMLAENLRSGGDFNTLEDLWETVQHYLPRNTAIQGLELIGKVALVKIDVAVR